MRLPFAPLSATVGQVWQINACTHQYAGHRDWGPRNPEAEVWQPVTGNPISVLSELTGVSRRTLTRWVKDGVPVEYADRMAVALGRHVCEIWPNWFDLVDLADWD